MGERHGRRLAESERSRRKYKQRRSATLRRHAGEARGLDAAVGPDAVDQWKPGANLVLRDIQHKLLLVEGAGRDLRRMGIDRERREALDRRHIAQVPAEARLVDRKVILERQEHRRNNALRYIRRVPWHRP